MKNYGLTGSAPPSPTMPSQSVSHRHSRSKSASRSRGSHPLLAAPRGLDSVISASEIGDDAIGSAQRKRQNANGGGLVGAIQENAGVADIKIRNIVSLTEAIGHELFWIVAHSAGASF